MNGSLFWRDERKMLLLNVGGFLLCFDLPVEKLEQWERLHNAYWESL